METTYNGMPASELQCATWRKSSFSGNGNNNCVEMARLAGGEVAVRNSRDPDGPTLIYTPDEVEALLRGVRNGEFDDLIG
jgi:Domain of unknown function (DUF397)